MSLGIVEFLNARLDDDEAIAGAVVDGTWGDNMNDVGLPAWEFGQHITPARTLSDVAAKRALIPIAIDVYNTLENEYGDGSEWVPPATPQYVNRHNPGYQMLLTLASVYVDYPDYQQEWKL